ncbi:flagellar protein FliT [Alkalilimnicola sp. S0819]|uniref:flagellar protein FliT n=1 Tax=Alkalilimnicola sp. S0819 TaxID=2613922 RepID=UPI001261E823|nr:flagellar protein FliT [Alkalilimnicola sp. S0819]KAB7627185.1 flagellar protein FliT [Alkalilimnicola sp. S0819]MPQ15897.1 flagellar protein FliT [Alkalilimnicola sp. S0819]
MAPQDRERLARELLELTQSMLAHARAGEWADLALKETRRQALARDLFATPVPPEAAPVVADCVRDVLTLDQELIQLTEASREQAARAVTQAQKGQQAATVYKRFSR